MPFETSGTQSVLLNRKREETNINETVQSDETSCGAHILMIIPRGEVIRNFVYTDCLDRIAEDAELSLLAVTPNAEMEEMLRRKCPNVYSLDEHCEKWIVRIQREILDMAHGRWLWSRAAQERWRLRDSEAGTITRKMIRGMKKAACYPFANRRGLRLLSTAERASSRVLKTTDEYLKLFQKIKPTLVFNGSHIHSTIATQAVQAAQWLGIPTATFIFSWDNLTSQGRITLPYDYYLVWNEELRLQLLEMYETIKPEQVFVTGTPQFDFHFQSEFYQSRDEFCESVGADPSRPIVLYTTGMANHMPGEPEIVEGIADGLKDLEDLGNPQFLVRVYPKDLTGRFDELKRRRTDILFPEANWEPAWLTPKYEDSYALVNTLRHTAVGINVASTVSLELCMFDKPTINVGYNPPSVATNKLAYADYYEFDHYKPIVESGAIEVAASLDEMTTRIRAALENPAARQKERAALIRNMFETTLDGKSGLRIARVLLDLGKKKNQ